MSQAAACPSIPNLYLSGPPPLPPTPLTATATPPRGSSGDRPLLGLLVTVTTTSIASTDPSGASAVLTRLLASTCLTPRTVVVTVDFRDKSPSHAHAWTAEQHASGALSPLKQSFSSAIQRGAAVLIDVLSSDTLFGRHVASTAYDEIGKLKRAARKKRIDPTGELQGFVQRLPRKYHSVVCVSITREWCVRRGWPKAGRKGGGGVGLRAVAE